MVKTALAASCCGLFLLCQASAQEVMVGNEKAKPKYPKAEAVHTTAAAGDHAAKDSPPAKKSTEQAKVAEKSTNPPATASTHKADASSAGPAKKSTAVAAASPPPSKPAAAEKKTPLVAEQKVAPPPKASSPPTVAEAHSQKGKSDSVVAEQAKKSTPAEKKTPVVAEQRAAAGPKPAASSVVVQTQTGKADAPITDLTKKAALAEKKAQVVAEQKATAAPKAAAAPAVAQTQTRKSESVAADQTKKITPIEKKAPAVAEQKAAPTRKSESAAADQAKKITPIEKKAPVVAEQKEKEPLPPAKGPGPAASSSKKTDAAVASAAKTSPLPPVKPVVRSEPVKKPAVNVASVSSEQEKSDAGSISSLQTANNRFDTAFTKLADGFDFPVGRPDGQGYYKARGFRSHGHMGEDWDGVGGGDTDLGDPIYAIGDGIVVFARDCHMGWGNVIIVRHSFKDGGTVRSVDSLYGHLNSMLVRRGQNVTRGQKIATMGTAHGLYDAHLHLEVRKNLEIGMSRAAFAQDFSNYYDPTTFINAHRHIANSNGTYRVAMNTFTHDAHIKWDKARNYSHYHGGTGESAANLKKTLAAKQN